MFEDFKHRGRRRVRVGSLVISVSAAVIAASVVAHADSPEQASKARSAPVAKAAGQTPGTDKKGNLRLGALRLGTRGTLIVSPKGKVPGPGTEHWFKRGTKVTIRAKDTKTAKFAGWSGDCRTKKRTCTLTMSRPMVAVAGFNLDEQAAKGLKKSDPRLKVVVSD
jgi:hypothetical protein